MMQRNWISSELVQPDNHQPVWIFYQQEDAPPGVGLAIQAVFQWLNFGEDPYSWFTKANGYLYGDRLWQSRRFGKLPEPPK